MAMKIDLQRWCREFQRWMTTADGQESSAGVLMWGYPRQVGHNIHVRGRTGTGGDWVVLRFDSNAVLLSKTAEVVE